MQDHLIQDQRTTASADLIAAAKGALSRPDSETCVLYLEVPHSQMVLLQGYFELCEGVGTLHTAPQGKSADRDFSTTTLLTTPTQLDSCLEALEAMRLPLGAPPLGPLVDWKFGTAPNEPDNFFI